MTNQDVLSEIRALKSDLNLFSDQVVRLRYDDLKSVFLEQMRVAMGDEGKRSFLDDASILSNSSCDLKGRCLQKLEETVDTATSAFMKDDLAGARNILDKAEVLIKSDISICQDQGCSKTAEEILRRLQVLLQIYEGLSRRFGPEVELIKGVNRDTYQYTADEIQSVLDPLANVWRIRVLTILRRGDHSLTELGRELELKTGHLQFHLRALVDAGFVELDRRRHRYSLNERGALVLSCSEEMVSKLDMLSSDEISSESVDLRRQYRSRTLITK
ncbi:MAG: winged helix-turn-helix domain-containing protein [Methanomassiliicoccales archaeon]|jgi:DNA-binding HxlR family transcriptional regulator